MKEKLILKALLNDLIGKDSQRGITLTYGWLANQVGHFALAFIPVTVSMHYFKEDILCMLWTVGIWTAFEVFNFLSPLFKGLGKTGNHFPIEWKNITFDTTTDVFFFWVGGYCAYLLSKEENFKYPFVIIAMILYVAFVTRKWYKIKFYQQRSGFPFQVRLSQWKGLLSDEQRNNIIVFKNNGQEKSHFLVLGNVGSGKTSLMVGLGNEKAIQGKKVRYTTFFKWIAELPTNGTGDKNQHDVWDWNEADFFIIDDINPGKPESFNLYDSSKISRIIDESDATKVKEMLSQKSVAWLIGEIVQGDSLENWHHFLESIGIEREAIQVIHLSVNH